jgi:hypothetical protein
MGGKRMTSTPSSKRMREGSCREKPEVLILSSFASFSSFVRSTWANRSRSVEYFRLQAAQIGLR